jgi:hypothetical protein
MDGECNNNSCRLPFLCGNGWRWLADNFRGNNRCLVRGDTTKIQEYEYDRTVCQQYSSFDFSYCNKNNIDADIPVATVASHDTLAWVSRAEGTTWLCARRSDCTSTKHQHYMDSSRVARIARFRNAATRHVLPA